MAAPEIGVLLPPVGTDGVGSVDVYARHAEDCGLHSVWTGDHLIATRPMLDSTLVLTAAAAATSRIRLGFGVLVLALRPVAWAAKQIATLQHLSGGRVLLGVGTGGAVHGEDGWRAAGVPFRGRGRRTDEALALLPGLIRGEPSDLGGAPVTLAPGAPVPPILAGGGPAALERAARYGDEWYPAFLGPAAVAKGAAELASLAGRYGRPVPAVTAGTGVVLGAGSAAEIEAQVRMLAGYGMSEEDALAGLITGDTRSAAERVAEFAEAGASRIVAMARGGDWFRQVELLGEILRATR